MTLQDIMDGLNNGLSSPTGLLALSLMSASGPSRMPVSTGQAMAQGYAGGQGMQGQVMQNQFQRMALQRQKAYLDALMGGMPSPDQPQDPSQTPPQAATQNPLMTPSTPTPTSNALDALTSGASPAQAQKISETPLAGNALTQPQGSPQGANPLTGDPILQDPRIQKDLTLANAAPDAATQTAWLTRARLDYDMLANTPQYKASQAGAVAEAQMPANIISDAMRYGLQPRTRTATESIYNPVMDPSNPLAGAFRLAANQVGMGSPLQGQTRSSGVNLSGTTPGGIAPSGGTGSLSGSPNTGTMGITPEADKFRQEQGQEASEYWKDLSGKAEAAKTQNNIIDSMRGDFNTFTPGKLAPYEGKASEWLTSLGFPGADTADKAAAYESSNKLSIQLQSAMTKTLGSREAAQVFSIMGNAIPNNTLVPQGFERVGDFMQGAGDYVLAKKQYAQQYADKLDPIGMNSVDAKFQKYSDPSFFIMARGSPEMQAQFLKEMGSKSKALAFLNKWKVANQMGLAPDMPQ